ncbi:hypothetical protein [Neogemmobacter tilapiae]|uniref:DUF4402 domain-containing protein n=1 Tax=Neogemmobacter tilapiae TaxID=875041 RepID=A0A918TX50_9RHOB|nr:hypothetical protein [Gemmobacter tilapiae]GHC66211.1 hypothetical protein GCM10007315_33720 [Gemmobacter tilapiae]
MIRALFLLLLASPAMADGTLEGRLVNFSVLVYDDPARPIFVGQGRTVQVGQGVEFGLDREGAQNGVDVVPVAVDISPQRIEVEFLPGVQGELLTAAFNGYVLHFETDCALFEKVGIDREFTTMAMTDADIQTEVSTLFINMSGKTFVPGQGFGLNVQVADCPLS